MKEIEAPNIKGIVWSNGSVEALLAGKRVVAIVNCKDYQQGDDVLFWCDGRPIMVATLAVVKTLQWEGNYIGIDDYALGMSAQESLCKFMNLHNDLDLDKYLQSCFGTDTFDGQLLIWGPLAEAILTAFV
jgi:hypothetical protein